MQKNSIDPEIHTEKKPFMQLLADTVKKGYTRYLAGTVRLAKVDDLANKFDRRYDCRLDKDRRHRARKDGVYTSHFLLYLEPGTDVVHWFLLVLGRETKKDEKGNEVEVRRWLLPEAANERWRDVYSKDRLTLTGYELLRAPKKNHSSEKENMDRLRKRLKEIQQLRKDSRWQEDAGLKLECQKIEKRIRGIAVQARTSFTHTWRYTHEREEWFRESLIRAIRTRRDDELRKLIQSIEGTPGFSETREQVRKFYQLIKAEWKRNRGTESSPQLSMIGFMNRKEHKTALTSQLLRKWEKQQNDEIKEGAREETNQNREAELEH
jgi:hypothetical protein